MSKVTQALTTLYERAHHEDRYELPLNKNTRLIILSDHHKGAQNRADDFRRNHPVYNAALTSYYERGYTLIVLGDGQELWQEYPRKIFRSYSRTYELEAMFHEEERYIRIWGNHDIDWKPPDTFASKAGNYFKRDLFNGLKTKEAVVFDVKANKKTIGELFLTHGHQGTLMSDILIPIARPFVRWIWRPIQRMFGKTRNSPATHYDLRKKHDRTMYEWAAGREDFILITGHTHRPVFCSQTHIGYLQEELAGLEENLKKTPKSKKLHEQIIEKKTQIEYRKTKDLGDTLEPTMDKPAYFNTGCCCYPDGDITGIEICYDSGTQKKKAGVYIKLIRWSGKSGSAEYTVLRERLLKDVFESV